MNSLTVPLIVTGFATAFEMFLTYLLLGNFFTERFSKKLYSILGFSGISVLLFVLKLFSSLNRFSLVLEVLGITAYTFIFFAGSIKSRAIFDSVVTIALSFCELLSDLLLSQIPKNMRVISGGEFQELLQNILPKMMLMLIVIIVLMFDKAKKKDLKLKYWLTLLSVPAISMVIISVFQYYLDKNADTLSFFDDTYRLHIADKVFKIPTLGLYGYIIISIIGLIFINILVFILFARLQSQLEMESRQENLEKQIELQERSIEKLEQSYSQMRELRHDLQNHLLVMGGLVEQKDIDGLRDYMKTMVNCVDAAAFLTITGNTAVDAVLNEKMISAKKNKIGTFFDIPPFQKLPCEAMDLCVILSNILDNAVEACQKCPDEIERFIKLKLIVSDNGVSLTCSNSAVKPPKRQNGNFITDKIDKQNHGIGMRSIKNTIAKYNGDLLTRMENNEFTIIVRLNREEQ